ncbi:MAG: reductive dehalogenase [Desulfobacterales bacterium]
MVTEKNEKDQVQDSSDQSSEKKTNPQNLNHSRRRFLKLGIAGAGAAMAAAGGITIIRRMEGIPHDEFPLPIRDEFKRIDQRNQINVFANSKALNDKHPERNRSFNTQLQKENPQGFKPFHFYETRQTFMAGPYRDATGYSQLERALAVAGFSSARQQLGGGSMEAPDSGVSSWKQELLAKNQFRFNSPKEATLNIKSAARLFGALRCGITKRDKRWDYDPMYDFYKERELSWERDFPFDPKTVIVIMAEMDYHTMAAAPSWMQDGTVGDAYANAIKIAGQLTIFLRQLGYQAVASMNDLGINAPYAIAAGLGEGARNGQVITPKYGPRVRISKVYTDFDLVEYDKARTFGVASFCLNCKRCANSCPSKAITLGDPSWEPTYSTDPDYIWHASRGVLKFHNDAKKCAKFWIDNDGSCGNCICSCPYNKPDFWHHRLVDAQNVIAPGPVHAFMREMDIFFGYGKVSDPDRVKKFWKLGKSV